MSNHNLTLALQLINTWNFKPVEEPLDIYINGIIYPHTVKTGGYRVFVKELPNVFTLSICSRMFFPLKLKIDKIPDDKIMPLELIPHYPPYNEAAWLTLTEPPQNIKIVLGFKYYRLISESKKDDMKITIKNPSRISAEGRRFLLKDTKSGAEEFIFLGAAQNALFETYTTPRLKSYYSDASILLPAFAVFNQIEPIPIFIPEESQKTYPIWLYAPEAVRFEATRGYKLYL